MKEEIKKYIYSQIINGNFSLLPPSIAKGNVYKIPSYCNLAENDFEIAYLYLREGSSILVHEHTKDIERYKCIEGTLKINGSMVDEDICEIQKSHCIDRVPVDTIIETFKIKKECMTEADYKEISTRTFEKVLRKSLLN